MTFFRPGFIHSRFNLIMGLEKVKFIRTNQAKNEIEPGCPLLIYCKIRIIIIMTKNLTDFLKLI